MKFKTATAMAAALIATSAPVTPAYAGTDAYIGEVMITGATYCPRSTAEMNGQLLAISSNTALFSLLGTTYGGDGRTTFALPDLRSRSPMHYGTGPGLSTRTQGQRFGSETNTLTQNQMPTHNHSVNVNNTAAADSGNPTGNHFARSGTLIYEDTEGVTPGATMASDTIGNKGGNQSVNNMQPTLVLRYCITTQGIFPPRN